MHGPSPMVMMVPDAPLLPPVGLVVAFCVLADELATLLSLALDCDAVVVEFRTAALCGTPGRGATSPSTTAVGDLIREGAVPDPESATGVGLVLRPVGGVGFGD